MSPKVANFFLGCGGREFDGGAVDEVVGIGCGTDSPPSVRGPPGACSVEGSSADPSSIFE